MSEIKEINSNDSSTTINNWLGFIESKSLQLPRIQRNSVWKNEKNAALLDSIIVGYPFGIITLATVNDESKKSFYIIDGLQRTIAIKNISSRYWELITSNETYFNRVIKVVATENKNNVSKYLNKLVEDQMIGILRKNIHHIFSDRSMLSIAEEDIELTDADILAIVEKIIFAQHEMTYKFDHLQLTDLFTVMHRTIREKIVAAKVPYQVYDVQTDDYDEYEAQLNEAFNRLNSAGVMLNAFELLTSTWNKYKIIVKNSNSILLTQLREIFKNKNDRRSILQMFTITNTITPSELLIGSISKAISQMDSNDNLFKRYFTVPNDHDLIVKVNDFMPFFMNVFIGQINKENELVDGVKNKKPAGKKISPAEELGINIYNFFNVPDQKKQDEKITGFINSLARTFEIVSDSIYEVVSFNGMRESEKKKTKSSKPKFEESLKDTTFIMTLLSTIWRNHVKLEPKFSFSISEVQRKWYLERSVILFIHSKINKQFSSATISRSRKLTNENYFFKYISDENWLTNKFNLVNILDRQYRRIYKTSNDDFSDVDNSVLIVYPKKRDFSRLSISISLAVHNLLLPSAVKEYGSNLVMDHFIPWNKAREKYGTNMWFNLSFIDGGKNLSKLDSIEMENLIYDPILINYLSKVFNPKIHGKKTDEWIPAEFLKIISNELKNDFEEIKSIIDDRDNAFIDLVKDNQRVEDTWLREKKTAGSGISCDTKIVEKIFRMRFVIYLTTLLLNT